MPQPSTDRYQYAVPNPEAKLLPDGTQGYVIDKGRIFEGVLENKLEGEFSGPVRVHTTSDAYSEDGKHLLVPAGSVLLGEATQVGSQYQRRLAVLFTDLETPGWWVDLGKATGLDQEGATALKDKVNRHIPMTIASVAAIGVLGGIAAANSGTIYNGSGTQRIYGGVGQTAAEMGMQILSQQMMRPPELTIRPGTRVRVWITKPLVLPEQLK
jgi:type IV secretion system protein VirB10